MPHEPGLAGFVLYMSSHYLRIFQQPKSAILLILGFASGLPLALTSGTLQAWMTVENIDLKTIGFFSLVGQAYVFKFLWSPVMDRYTPPFLGRRRGWLLTTQVLLLAIAAMGFLEPATQLRWMAALAVVIAFCSASQDIVFDAWKTDVLPRKSAALARRSACWAIASGCWSPAVWRCGWPTAISAGRACTG
jgi:PAT family beta-lactamase induction signal transducer AmpG